MEYEKDLAGFLSKCGGLPVEDVQAEVKKASRVTPGRSTTRVIAGEQGAQRSVVVERRIVRKFGNDKRTGM